MKKEDIDGFLESHDCISGVHNYCDRWCERCPLTSRCLNYLMTDGHFGSDAEGFDLTNEIFWDKLSEMLMLTLDMVRETAEEMGIDLDALTDGPETEAPDPDAKEVVVHVIKHLAKAYGERADNWFKNLTCGPDELPAQPVQLHDHKDQADALCAADAMEVIGWYQFQIYVKICRALGSNTGAEENDEDADGSAKVALIGIDRSISAWGVMLKLFPESGTEIMPLVNLLEKLRHRTEKEFPKARNFLRPGFDSPRFAS